MLCNQTICGQKIELRDVLQSDCNANYLRWMTDKETNRYMETRWVSQTLESIASFVHQVAESRDSILFAIIERQSGRHIGNIKLGPINSRYHYADISYFIGEKEMRGKGYAKEAVELICDYGFRSLRLHRIQAGVIDGNDISAHVLRSCGFKLEARLRDKFIVNNKFADHLIFGLLDSEK